MAIISPSLLSADFSNMAEGARLLLKNGADWLHCDVMDGSFVPNISFGPMMIRDLRKALGQEVFLDVHLMIEHPERYIKSFAEAGASLICVHAEACVHLQRVLSEIRAAGVKVGVAINPATSPDSLEYIYEDVDLVLCMTVNPGFGGQKLIPAVIKKVSDVDARRRKLGLGFDIEVDGGISSQNAEELRKAGASVLVAGNAVFKAKDMRAEIAAIKG